LVADNVKRIKAVDITPNKFINRISGGNGSGKTSTLDTLEMCFRGGKSIPSRPVRNGAVRATIKIDMGETGRTEAILTRQFFEGSSKRAGRLNIDQKPGGDASEFEGRRAKITTPDELEDALLKQISFDPLEFMRMEPKKQYHVLRRISTPSIDMDALDAEIQTKFDERTVAGRRRDQLEAQRDAILVPEGLPTEKRDERAMLAELTELSGFNSAIEREAREREDERREMEVHARAVQDRELRIIQLTEEIERLTGLNREEFKKLETRRETFGKLPPLAEPKDAAALAQQIEEARTINRAIERSQDRAKIHAEYAKAQETWSALDAAVKEGERRKKEAIAHAKYPVEGLGFGDQAVMYNGLPFEQASNAEQIKVSAAIGMTTNSRVRVMRIKDGSLLDDDSLNVIAEMAYERDFQVFLEVVDNTGEVGFYMEDGEIKAVNDEPLDRIGEKKGKGEKGKGEKKASGKVRAKKRNNVEEKPVL